MKSRTQLTFLVIFVQFTFTRVYPQIFEDLTKPRVTVSVKHPPGLGIKVNKIAFGPGNGNCSDQIIEELTADFVSSNMDVMDRQNLNTILNEHNLTLTGYIDQTSAAKLGKILGPTAYVIVKVQVCSTKVEQSWNKEEYYDSYYKIRRVRTVYYTTTKSFFRASVQTIDLTTAKIFSALTFEYPYEQKNSSYEGYPVAPEEFTVQSVSFHAFELYVHRMFLEWTENMTLVFYNDNKFRLKDAYRALKAGDIEKAFELSKQSLDDVKNTDDVKDKVVGHAFYNLGILYMIKGDYEKALKKLEKADEFHPGDIVTKAIADCKKSQQLLEDMQKVEQKASLAAEKEKNETERNIKEEVANTLTNQDIIKMTKQNIPEAIIIKKINASKCNFVTNGDALVALTKAGVKENVISAMIEKQ
jgi:tetratricopeptide (TPR) repeat protein